MSTDLARKQTVTELVECFEQAERDVRHAFALIVDAGARVNDAFMTSGSDRIRVDASTYGYHDDFLNVDRAISKMSRDAWKLIAARLELSRVMSIKDWEALQKYLSDGDLPPFTVENVNAFGSKYIEALPDLFNKAVEEVFNWLRPRGNRYKTNSELEIGPRVVMIGIVERGFTGAGTFRVNYYRTANLAALERVFTFLDGHGIVTKHWRSDLQIAIEASTNGIAETPYFHVRMFRNGNAHITFRRLDLLAEFNRRAGGMRLRPVG